MLKLMLKDLMKFVALIAVAIFAFGVAIQVCTDRYAIKSNFSEAGL